MSSFIIPPSDDQLPTLIRLADWVLARGIFDVSCIINKTGEDDPVSGKRGEILDKKVWQETRNIWKQLSKGGGIHASTSMSMSVFVESSITVTIMDDGDAMLCKLAIL